MEIQMNDWVTVETEVPLLEIHEFYFFWKMNEHGVLKIRGLLNPKITCQIGDLYDSKVKIKKGGGEGGETIFCGCLTDMVVSVAGNVNHVTLEITTGSCRLDRKKGSQSFQNVESTYEDTVRGMVEAGGGRVICTAGKETAIGRPVIRYQETEWEFAKRLASHLGTWIIADVEVGKPNFWFGIRNGKELSSFAAEDYHVYIRRDGDGMGEKQAVFEVESREFHQLGDMAMFWGLPVMVFEVRAAYRQGNLTFTYLLSEKNDCAMIYRERFIGMELLGRVEEVKGEQVKLALEIDGGISTGNYFYEWYPETGNGMYAMPEKGSKVFLTFGSIDEREGFAVRCQPVEAEEQLNYQNRSLMTKERNTILMNETQVSISGNEEYEFMLSDQTVSFMTPKKLRIRAAETIQFQAKEIYLSTLDVIEIHQG